MAREVDQRVVEMQFNNGSFERNCKETLSTLDRLKDALKFDGAGSSIDSIEAKFSTLQIVVANVLSDIASKAVDIGAKIAKALSVDQLVAGWSKYDAAIASEQKIMSSVSEKINSETGELFTLDDVTKRIEKLQWYTDETSYNIDQMMNAIGDFTASGVDLDVAVDAIFGISNACADAGITAEQAASAYIGFAKAIGSGKMSLGIWSQQLKTSGITNSERFRQSLFEAIKANSKLIKINKETGKSYIQVKKGKEVVEEEISAANFEQYFKEGIATTDSILQALKSYSDTVNSLYGLTNDGQLDTSSEVIQKLTKEIEKQGKTLDDYGLAEEYDTASEAIRSLTKAYEELGLEVPKSLKAFARAQEAISFSQAIESIKVAMSSGMSKSFELLFGNYETAKNLWTELANDLYDVFITAGNTRNEVLELWKERGGQDRFIKGLKIIFQDFVLIKDAVDDGIKKVFPGLYDVEELTRRLIEFTRKFIVRVHEINDSLNDTDNADSLYNKIVRYSKNVSKIISDIINFTKKAWGVISPILKNVINISGEIVKTLIGAISKIKNRLAADLPKAKDSVLNFIKSFNESESGIKFKELIEKVKNFINSIYESFKSLKWVDDIYDNFVKGITIGWSIFTKIVTSSVKIGSVIISIIKKIITAISNLYKSISESELGEKFKTVSGTIQNGVSSISESFKNLDLAGTLWNNFVSIIKTGWSVLSKVFGFVLDAINSIFSGLKDSIKDGSFTENLKTFIGMLLAFDIGKLLLNINNGITSFTKGLQEAMWYLEVDSLLTLAEALAILVASVVLLSAIDTEKLASATVALGALFTELAIAFNTMYGLDSTSLKKSVTNIADSFSFSLQMKGLMQMAEAIAIISASAYVLSLIDSKKLDYSMASISAFIWQLVAVAKVLGNGKTELKKGTTGLIEFSSAILILSLSVKLLSGMDFTELARAGAGLLGLSIILVASAKILGSGSTSLKKATSGLISFSIAIGILSLVSKLLATMEWEELGKAGAGLLGLAIILVASAKILGSGSSSFAIAAIGLPAFAIAIGIMAVIAKVLGKMSWGQLAKAGAGLLGIATILVASALILGQNSAMAILAGVAMIAMAAAFAILVPQLLILGAMSWESIAKGFVVLAGALVLFGLAGAILGPMAGGLLAVSAAILLFGVGLMTISVSILVASVALQALALAFDVLSVSFASGGEIIITGINAILLAIIALIPDIILALGQGVLDLLTFFGENGPTIIEAVVNILSALLDAVIELIPKIVDLVITIITEVCRSLDECIPVMVKTAIGMLLAMLHGIADNIEEVVKTALDVVTGFLNGIAAGIGDVIQAGVNLCLSFIEGIANAFDDDENHRRLKDALLKLLRGLVKTVLGGWELLKDVGKEALALGKNMIDGIKKGIEETAKNVINAVKDVAEKAWDGIKNFLGISSPSKLFAEVGKYTVLGMSKGIDDNAHYAEESAEEMAKGSFDTVASVMSKISDAVDSNMDITPTITPLVDISDIEKKASGINNLLGGSYGIDGSLNLASKTAGGFNIMSANKNDSGLTDDMYVANASQSINNTFNITGDNPKEIAQEVSRILAKQVERKQASWA